MKNDTPLHEKYPDLLGRDPDPRLAHLIADLDTVSMSAQPPASLSTSIERALMERDVTTQARSTKVSWSQRLRSWRPRPLHLNPMSATATILVAVLLLTGAAYAVAPLLRSVFQLEQGLQHIDESKLGQEVHLSQTINGWTMTVGRIYADDNRVVIGYTATGPQSSQRAHSHCSTLRDEKGNTFPPMSGVGNSDGTSTSANAVSFDLGVLPNPPKLLSLSLSCAVDVITPVEDTSSAPQPSAGDPSAARAEAKRADSQQVAGPFNFTFSVPVIPARIAELGQTMQANGYAVTLERVVVTPSETRAILRYKALGGPTISNGAPIITLRIDGHARGTDAMTSGGKVGMDKVEHHLFAPLYDEQGEWSLTVTELVLWPGIEQGASDQLRVPGPWTFTFTLPTPVQD